MITIKINTENGAFQEEAGGNYQGEVKRVIKEIINKWNAGEKPECINDINGNECVEILYTGEDKKNSFTAY